MTLTLDHGPLSTYPPREANYSVDGPPHKLLLTPFPRRVRAMLAGETVLDSRRGMLLHESNILPQLYVPEEDVRAELLELTDQRTHCPFKGDAAYRSIRVGDRVAENALWHYSEPLEASAWLRGLVAPYWDRFDEWWDEDERVYGHLRDPYHRVDVRDSSRHVVVRAGDEVVADSTRPKLLSETGLPNRYYLPREDVRAGLIAERHELALPVQGRGLVLVGRGHRGRAVVLRGAARGRRKGRAACLLSPRRPDGRGGRRARRLSGARGPCVPSWTGARGGGAAPAAAGEATTGIEPV